MLETRQLQIFRTIVEVGSFTGAGEQLGLSQPAISQQVRALEEAVGLTLLVRESRRTRATPAGEVLFHYARQVLDRVVEAEHLLAEHRRGRTGVVRFGTPEPACNYLLPPVLADFMRRFPRVDVRVSSGHTATTLARLAAGELDLGLLPLPLDAGKLRVVEAGRDELVAIVAADHPWSELPWVGASEFTDVPLVLYDRASQITERTLSFLLDDGVFPRIAVEIDHLEGLKELVASGVGVAVVPAWSARRECAAGSLRAVRLGPGGLPRTWGVLYAEERRLPPVVRELAALLATALGARMADTGAAHATQTATA